VKTKGERHHFEVQVHLGELDPDAVRVELFAEGAQGEEPVRKEMKDLGQTEGPTANRVYGARVPASRPAADYTARLIPRYQGLAIPLEAPKIRWQR
jgi:starch phosphorylase